MMCYINPVLQKQLEIIERQEQTKRILEKKNKEQAREQLLRIQLILDSRNPKAK